MHAQFFKQDPEPGSSSREARMNWSHGIRRTHRWLAIAFTLSVIANFVAYAVGEPPLWLVYSPLPPLFLLMFSGLYMFALPYAERLRGGRIGS